MPATARAVVPISTAKANVCGINFECTGHLLQEEWAGLRGVLSRQTNSHVAQSNTSSLLADFYYFYSVVPALLQYLKQLLGGLLAARDSVLRFVVSLLGSLFSLVSSFLSSLLGLVRCLLGSLLGFVFCVIRAVLGTLSGILGRILRLLAGILRFLSGILAVVLLAEPGAWRACNGRDQQECGEADFSEDSHSGWGFRFQRASWPRREMLV